MRLLMETAQFKPPLIIIRDTEFVICGSDCDANLWLTPENMRNENAFVIYDPDGSLHKQYADTLYHDYKRNIKVLNPVNIKQSMGYNPFAYIRSNKDVVRLADALIMGTKGIGKPGDIEFLSAEKMLLTALISYMDSEAANHERNVSAIIEVLQYMEVRKDDDGNRYMNAIDFLMKEKELKEPEHLSVRQYNLFEELTWDEPENVIKSCIERFTPFDTDDMKDFFSNDELGLEGLNFRNTVLFVIAENTANMQLNPIVSLMYSQLFDILHEKYVQ